ncbi:MAG: sulfurtransferase [Deltaproteobacteria bacterium]|nr:sulfurtransferase [Deltaproteobacteria bacterium]
MSRRITLYLFCCLLTLTVAVSLLAQTQTPAAAAPTASPEKKASEAATPEKKPGVPEDPKKHTSLGLYATAREAYDMWQKDKDKIKILDCRTPEEYAFVGHAPMAVNIPSQFMTYRWNPEKKDYVMKDNAKFVEQVKKVFKPTDTVLIMCRSGHRSAASVERLAKAGFKNLYNIHDGFEGDKVRDKNDPNYGKRMKNGWRYTGLPWTYDLDPNLMYLPYGKGKGK